jgi:hypothetical protein
VFTLLPTSPSTGVHVLFEAPAAVSGRNLSHGHAGWRRLIAGEVAQRAGAAV